MLNNQLQQFIKQSKQIATKQDDIAHAMAQMRQWQDDFSQVLKRSLEVKPNFSAQSALLQGMTLLAMEVQTQIGQWSKKWQTVAAAQSVAQMFDNKVMLLVFGKFNAGKSSFCNLLAECFRLEGEHVRYFHILNEQVYYTDALLREGATETTAQLQGVCLGENLVLLDTPGLHSATEENSALTQRFIDSADGVLWLSSSSSPGQVQELQTLVRELRRHKPLLPIITRSDYIEEDEVDGEICSVLRNKNTAQRALQQADVLLRARDKLHEMRVDVTLLQPPVSISGEMLRQHQMTVQAMLDSGFEQLFAVLLAMIEPALNYKQRKPAEIFLHYLQEHVVEDLVLKIEPLIAKQQYELEQARQDLLIQKDRLAEAVWRQVLPELPALLAQHAPHQQVEAVLLTLAEWLQEAFHQQVQQLLAIYQIQNQHNMALHLAPQIGYEILAGQVVYEQLYTALSHELNRVIQKHSAAIIVQCEVCLDKAMQQLQQFMQQIDQYAQDLERLAQYLRAG